NKLLEKSSSSDLAVQSEAPSEEPQTGGPARRLASLAVEQLDEEGQRCQLQSQAEELGCRNSARKAKDDSLQRCVQEQDGEFRPALESQGALRRRGVCTQCKSDRTERELEKVEVGEQKSASRNDPEEKEGGEKLFKRPCRQKRENSASSESEDQDCCVPSCVADERKAHISEIDAITFSPDSSMLATGGSDGLIKLWNVAGGCLRPTQTLEASTGSITGLEFNPSGRLLLAATYNNAAQLWKVGGRRVKEILTGHTDKVTAARFKPVWHQAVTGSRDRTVKVWDLAKMACFRTIQVFSYCNDVVCCDNVIVSGHHDKRIRFWDSR
ncbi:autophagy-related protein 16-2-like, partial [Python bivittatus]|uniref:Autophagy-related protein 16-2-like n=1 Tax=Python bivittatus TaxID=176946 RepID=A0A9F5J569_PYTBI